MITVVMQGHVEVKWPDWERDRWSGRFRGYGTSIPLTLNPHGKEVTRQIAALYPSSPSFTTSTTSIKRKITAIDGLSFYPNALHLNLLYVFVFIVVTFSTRRHFCSYIVAS